MGNRNKLFHLLAIYEALLEGRQTFYALRHDTHIGYNSLKSLLEKLIEEEYVFERIIDDTRFFKCTDKLIQLFDGSLYSGIKELEDI